MSKADEASAHRAANHPDTPEQPVPPQQEPAPDGQPKAPLGPLGQFFQREAEFYRGEALSMAVMLERLALASREQAGKE
jgi:hypothetical protein